MVERDGEGWPMRAFGASGDVDVRSLAPWVACVESFTVRCSAARLRSSAGSGLPWRRAGRACRLEVHGRECVVEESRRRGLERCHERWVADSIPPWGKCVIRRLASALRLATIVLAVRAPTMSTLSPKGVERSGERRARALGAGRIELSQGGVRRRRRGGSGARRRLRRRRRSADRARTRTP